MIKKLEVYFDDAESELMEKLTSWRKSKRDEARGEIEALMYLKSVCAHHKTDLQNKVEEETAQVFYDKLKISLHVREEKLWLAAITAHGKFKKEVIGQISNVARHAE